MPTTYLHGIDDIRIDDGLRPIRTVRSAVIGLVGVAPNADDTLFPEGEMRLIAGRRSEAAGLGAIGAGPGDLPAAMDAIFKQAGALVVVYRAAVGVDAAATQANVIAGIQALAGAEAVTGFKPRILVAPGHSANSAVAAELVAVTERLLGYAYIDGPDTGDAAAITYRGNFGSGLAEVCDPWFTAYDPVALAEVARPPSAYLAGLRAKVDADRGFWWPISNQVVNGVTGTTRVVDFSLGDTESRANLLNENEVTTVIRDDGFRVWGLRTTASDPLEAFGSVNRTINMVVESAKRAHRWALDRPFSAQLLLDVRNSVQAYIDTMEELGALLGGEAWIDPDVNAESELKAGRFFLDFDLEPPAPMERLTFRVRRNGDYYVDLIDAATSAAA